MAHTDSDDTGFDRGFLSRLIAHHQSPIEMAQIALERAEHAELRELAQTIIRVQGAEQDRIRGWLAQWYPGASGDAAETDMSAVETQLETLRRAQPFDRAFIDAMIPDHQEAIQEAQTALERAEHPEVRDLAQNVVTSQQQEIDRMRAWRASWYGV